MILLEWRGRLALRRRGIEGAICALTSETPFSNSPCPIQRASSRSNATTGHSLITGRQRQILAAEGMKGWNLNCRWSREAHFAPASVLPRAPLPSEGDTPLNMVMPRIRTGARSKLLPFMGTSSETRVPIFYTCRNG